MTRITLDATAVAKLQGKDDLIEICDEQGNTLGHFYRFREPPRDAQGRLICPYSDEEIAALSQQQGGRPLADILNELPRL